MKKPPITVIEILSPKQAVQDLVDKFDEYFKVGVKSCWLVIPTLEIVGVLLAIFIRSRLMLQELFKIQKAK
jgi:Uma2 family endonuclease